MNKYHTITELPGSRAHAEQLSGILTRYDFAARHAKSKDVLEVACGSGIGLGYLASQAKSVVGGDIDPINIHIGLEYYKGRAGVRIMKLDALALPFPDHSYDVLVCFEAIYYFRSLSLFLSEARRVLRPKGIIVGCTVNCEWHGFNPSPFSQQYYPQSQLQAELRKEGFETQFFLGFEDNPSTLRRRMTACLRSAAVWLHVMPKTMKGKEWLKRLFYGELVPLPSEITGDSATVQALVEFKPDLQLSNYKVIYFLAHKLVGGDSL